MTTTAEQVRAYHGPAVLSLGFRPFFLAGAMWAAISVALWLPMLAGHVFLPTALAPLDWHAHELLYGYVPAVVAGFLLTAVPSWTNRPPIVGGRLLALLVVWLAGRLAVLFSLPIGVTIAAIVDLSFLALLGAVVAREIVAGRDKRNLKVLVPIAILLAGNAAFHSEVAAHEAPGFGTRTGIAAIVLLIMLIGGRIVPTFTRNWLAKRGEGRLPLAFGRFDVVVMASSGIALASWAALPDHAVTAVLAGCAAILNFWRLARWAGDRTTAESLVMILHIGFAFVPLGFALVAVGIVRPDIVMPSGALHAWTAGAIGIMTLAVMTRASLGHTSQPLTATRPVQLIYTAAAVAAITRILAAFQIMRESMLHVSATAWVLAFMGFVIVYAPSLLRTRH